MGTFFFLQILTPTKYTDNQAPARIWRARNWTYVSQYIFDRLALWAGYKTIRVLEEYKEHIEKVGIKIFVNEN
jgi:hypothetical protein